MEYAIESAAIFNPSIVEDFDQSNLERKRYYLSEPLGKVTSSIVF
jgi:hypothetical protein